MSEQASFKKAEKETAEQETAKKETKNQIRVLLSFNSEYVHLAQQLAADLNAANIQVIYDQWRGGDGITTTESIENTLENIDFVIPILTPSEASPIWLGEAWKQKIYAPARSQNIEILPVLGAKCKPPTFLKGLSYANLVSQKYGFEVQRLVSTMFHQAGDGNTIKIPEMEELASNTPSPFTLPSKQILIEVGEALAPFFENGHEDGNVENNNGATFFREQIPMMRDGLFYELGVTFPSVTVQMATTLQPCAARVLLNGVPESQVEILPDVVMVNASVEEMEQQKVEATAVTNPASGMSCAWIPIAKREEAEEAGLTTWDTQGFVILWLAAVLRRKAASFIGVDETQTMLNQLTPVFPQLVAETVPKAVSLFLLTDVLRRLVVEEVGCIPLLW